MTVTTLPNVERMWVRWATSQHDVLAIIPADSILRNLAGPVTGPTVRITRLFSVPVTQVAWVAESVELQVDVWGGTQDQAEHIAQVLRTLTHSSFSGFVEDGGTVVTAEVGSLAYRPDGDSLTEAGRHRPRYVFTVSATVRTKEH